MITLLVIIHVTVCIALILIVLLQTGKGADMGAVFGGAGSQTLFGNTGATTFLGKLTTGAAIVFMITSLSLAYLSKSGGKSVVSDIAPPAQETKANVPDQPTPVAPEKTAPATESNQENQSDSAGPDTSATEKTPVQTPGN